MESFPVGVGFLVQEGRRNEDGCLGRGKCSLSSHKLDVLIPNDKILEALCDHDSKLKNTAIFLAVVDINKVPARKSMDEWMSVWGKKIGISFSYC